MRIWSIHPKYLDSKGLVALWRETLLAKNVLEGNTKGYQNHPQLNRFKALPQPLNGINYYLSEVYLEAKNRGYHFTKEKIDWSFSEIKMNVTNGQIFYEQVHLMNKLTLRDPELKEKWKDHTLFEAHPMFNIIGGKIENWEIIS